MIVWYHTLLPFRAVFANQLAKAQRFADEEWADKGQIEAAVAHRKMGSFA